LFVILAQPPQVVILSAAATEIVILASPPWIVILASPPWIVILAQPESPYWPLFVFVRHSERSSESLSLPL
jgi:hypothetical protein